MSAKRELQPPPPSLVFAPVGKDRISPFYLEKKDISLFTHCHCIWNGRCLFQRNIVGQCRIGRGPERVFTSSGPFPFSFVRFQQIFCTLCPNKVLKKSRVCIMMELYFENMVAEKTHR